MKIYYTERYPLVFGAEPRTPSKAHPSDAGWDLYSSRDQTISEREKIDLHTDICIAVPENEGWFAMIQGRSSTAARWGLIVLQGVVDAGYRGEMFIQVYNPLDYSILIPRGTRLAQLLFLPVPQIEWELVTHLPSSSRGARGFGHSGA